MKRARSLTVADVLAAHRGAGPGFDAVRLTLSLSVVLFHSFQISYGRSWSAGWFAAPVLLIVPAFFALSGFLVAGSMLRTGQVGRFLALRVLRIAPALGAEITLSALVLGPLTTTLPLSAYAADPAFARYFTNAVGIIRYALPGVFTDNPLAGIVNGQLWTIPSELHCYLAMAAIMVLGLQRRRRVLLAVLVLLAAAETATALLPGHVYRASVLNAPETLVLCFLAGTVAYLWQDRIPVSRALFGLAVAGFAAVVTLAPVLSFTVGVASAAYLMIYLGLQRAPRVPLLMTGDYSYGIYLYSFPIQQAVAWAFPDQRAWWFNLVLGLPPTLLFAAASWHWLEKPCLSLRRLLRPPTGVSGPAG